MKPTVGQDHQPGLKRGQEDFEAGLPEGTAGPG